MIPESGICQSKGMSTYNFDRYCQIVFKKGTPKLHIPKMNDDVIFPGIHSKIWYY